MGTGEAMARGERRGAEWQSRQEYHHQPKFEHERSHLLWHEWMCVGHVSAFEGDGSFVTTEILGESVVLVRGDDGAFHSFANVCPHRGSRLCGHQRGRFDRLITCPYHGWAFDLEGHLVSARSMRDDPAFAPARHGLVPIRVEPWRGFLWLCLGTPRGDLAPQLESRASDRLGKAARLDAYELPELERGARRDYTVSANWKIVVENLLECYHCAPVHPTLCRYLPGLASGTDFADGDAAHLADGIESFTTSGESSHPPFSGLSDDARDRYYGLVLLPNAMLNLFPDHVIAQYVFPQSVDSTRVVCDWLFPKSALGAPGFDPGGFVELFDRVNREDWEVCEMVQRGTASKMAASSGVLAPHETQLLDFRRYVQTGGS